MEKIPKSLFDTIIDRIPDISDELSALPDLGSAAGALGSFGGTIASKGIAIGLEQVLEITVTAIENWINRVEIARERSSKIMEEYDQRNNINADRKKTVWQFADRYDELSKGVDLLTNKNNALSSEEYAEFLNINTQLAKSFPELIKGIDDNGNSILKLGAKGTTAKKQLQELLQTEEELNNFKIANDLEKSFEGMYTYIKDGNNATDELENAKKQSGVLPNFVEHGVQLKNNNYRLFGGDITDNARTNYAYAMQSSAQDFMNNLNENRRTELQSKGITASELFSMKRNDNTGSFELYANLYLLTPTEIKKLQKKINDNVENLKWPLIDQFGKQEMGLEEQIKKGENAWTDFVPQLVSDMKSEQTFKNLKDQDLQNMAIQIVEGLDTSYANAMDQYDPNPYAWVRDKIIVPMSELGAADKRLLTTSFQDLFNLNLEDMNVDDARINIQYYCAAIAKILGKSLPEVQTLLGFDDFFQTASKYDQTVAYASGGNYKSVKDVDGSKGYNQKDVIDAMDKNSINTDEEIEKFQEFLEISNSLDEAVKAYRSASKETNATPLTFDEAWTSIGTSGNEETDARDLETKERLLELAEAGKLTEKELSKSSLAKIFTDAGISIEEATQKINNMKSSVDQLTTMETGISSISTILSQKQENWSSKETHHKGIDISQLSAMPEDVRAQKKEYEHFVEVLSTGTSTMDECRNAADNLATAYLNNSNFLAKLTEENEDYYTSVLSQMGIENAAQIVTNTLSKQKINARISTFNLKTATKQEINSLGNYVVSLKGSRKALAYYTLQQQLANKNALKTSGSIKNLKSLAKQCGITGEAIDLMTSLAKDKKDLKQYTTGKKKNDRYAGENISKIKTEIKGKTKRLKKIANEEAEVQPDLNFDNPSDPGGGTKDSPKSTQQIDWISRALDRLSSRLDLVKAKYDNLFNNNKVKDSETLLKKQTKNLNDQYKILKKTAKYQEKAQKKYTAKAKKVKISKNKKENASLKKAVRQGRIKGKAKDLIATYGEKKANKILKYQDWYDKAREAEKNKINAQKAARETRIQNYQNIADNADEKRSLAQAQKENATTATAKNDFIKKEKESVEAYYNNQIKIANLKRDSLKADQLRVEKAKELNDLDIEHHQNLADEYQSKLDQYGAEKELATKASEKNAIIAQEEAKTRELYAEKITIAGLEGNTSEQKQLQAELDKQLRDFDIERHQNLADEIQAELDKSSAEKANLTTANKKNAVVDREKALTQQLYAEKIAIAYIDGKISEREQLQEELARKMVESEKEKFDNIAHYYENLMKLQDNSYADLNNAIDELEARGMIVGASLYTSQIQLNNEKKAGYEEELKSLEEQLPRIKEGTDEWYDAQDAIQACNNGIAETTKKTIELNKAIRQVPFLLNEKVSTRLQLVSSEFELITKFMSNKEMFDDKTGNFTKEGTATLASYYNQLSLAQKETKNTKTALDDMLAAIERGDKGYEDKELAMQEYYEKYDEYLKLAGTELDIQQKLIDMMKEKYQAELDYLKDIIDKRKELLDTEKEAYDYQKTIEEKTRNISSLTKQLEASKGDDSEAGKLKLQQLQVSLDEARQDLQDTEYDKWISDQKEMLDKLYNDYSAFIDDHMNDTDSLLREAIDYLEDPSTRKDFLDTWDTYMSKHDFDPENDLTSVLNALGKEGSIVSAINNLSDIIIHYYEIQQKISDIICKNSLAGNSGTNSSNAIDGIIGSPPPTQSSPIPIPPQDTTSQTTVEYVTDPATTFQNAAKNGPTPGYIQSLVDKYQKKATLSKNKYGILNQYIYEKTKGKLVVRVDSFSNIAEGLGLPKTATQSQIVQKMKDSGYSHGGIAETLQKIPGMNGDDGWATLKRGESVLTPEQTKQFQKLAQNLDVLNSAVNILPNLQKQRYNHSFVPDYNTTQSIGDVNIQMEFPNVTNYEEFRQKLQSDPKIEKYVKSVIWDKGDLSKYKINM